MVSELKGLQTLLVVRYHSFNSGQNGLNLCSVSKDFPMHYKGESHSLCTKVCLCNGSIYKMENLCGFKPEITYDLLHLLLGNNEYCSKHFCAVRGKEDKV